MSDATPATRTKVELPKLRVALTANDLVHDNPLWASRPTREQWEEIAHRCNVHDGMADAVRDIWSFELVIESAVRNADPGHHAGVLAALKKIRTAFSANPTGVKAEGRAEASCNYEPNAEGYCTKCGRRHYPEASEAP